MAPVKLYGPTLSWNVTRCVVALEEAGVEYQLVPINLANGEHKSPDHLARNPFGQVPALQDGDMYLFAKQYNAALGPILFECLVHPMLGGTTDQKLIDANLVKMKNVLAVYEARLTNTKYMAGDYLSLADLNHASVNLCLAATPYASLFDAYPHVKAWWTDLLARPSVQKAVALMKP